MDIIPTGPSPLLSRARGGTPSSGNAFPRRGRIRVVLALVVAAGVVVVLRNRRADASMAAPTETPSGLSVSVDSLARDRGAARNKPVAEARRSFPSKEKLTYDDVAAVARRHAARLTYASDTVDEGRQKLALFTSVDTALQRRGMILFKRYRPKYGAMAIIESATGRVLCIVSYVNENEPFLGRDLYCRNYFPAASVFKAVTAAGVIEKSRYSPETELRQTGPNHTLYTYQLAPELKNYRSISLADAFAYSINPVFGRLGIFVLGADGLSEYAERFGFGQAVPFELEVDTAQVGALETSFAQAEIASGFNQETRISPLFGALLGGAIAEGGTMLVPHLVDSVTDVRTGKRLYQSQPRPWRLTVKPSTATHVRTLMRNVVRYGTARNAFSDVKKSRQFSELEYGGKTGSLTRDGMGKVDWFVGFLRDEHDPQRRLGVAVVTVHGENWTVHSSYLAAEMMRAHVRQVERRRKESATVAVDAQKETSDG